MGIKITKVSAQSATLNGDTLTYGTNKYYSGKTIQIWYGSKSNKGFEFITLGNVLNMMELPIRDSKHYVILTRINKIHGKYFIIGKLQDVGALEPYRISIDIEGAVDNKEIKED